MKHDLGDPKYCIKLRIMVKQDMSTLYYTFFNCWKTFFCNDSKRTEFEMIDTKNFYTAYVVMYELITRRVLD